MTVDIILIVVFAISSYLFGNLNWAILISKIKRTDIRTLGSGNPGTLNMSRNLGLKIGLLTFFLDIMKGVAPTLIAFFVFGDKRFDNSGYYINDFAMYLCGFCVVLGHIYPVFLKFKGGKGIASTIGVFLVCESVWGWEWFAIAIMALVAAAVFIYFTEFGAMGSFIAITPPAVGSSIRLFLAYEAIHDITTIVLHVITNMIILAICFFTWFAHRRNIERMLAGDEHPTSIKEMVIKAKAKKLAKQKLEEEKNKTTN